MTLLSPKYAAALAEGVYRLNENPDLDASDRALLLRCKPDFLVGHHGDDLATGRLGDHSRPVFGKAWSGQAPAGFKSLPGGRAIVSLFSPDETDFGYVANGQKDKWPGHMVIVTRGTMGKKFQSNDWISNYNVGQQPGPNGFPVHAGFNRIWLGLRDFVLDAVKTYKPQHIHCVGHSLGGALASLNAELLMSKGHAVSLYTFGCPRVGTLPFATEMTQGLQGRIKRVYHPADPVPMIPLLPFLHAPLSSGIRLAVPAGALVDGAAHEMGKSYEVLIGDQDWGQLESATTLLGDFQIDTWLQQSAKQRGGFVMRSAALLEKISLGLGRLIAKAAIYVIGSGLSAAATATLTSLDFIAWLLARAGELQDAIREEIIGLVNAIFGFLGRVANNVAVLTRTVLRWVLDLLYSFLAGIAQSAIDRLLR